MAKLSASGVLAVAGLIGAYWLYKKTANVASTVADAAASGEAAVSSFDASVADTVYTVLHPSTWGTSASSGAGSDTIFAVPDVDLAYHWSVGTTGAQTWRWYDWTSHAWQPSSDAIPAPPALADAGLYPKLLPNFDALHAAGQTWYGSTWD